MKQNKSKPRRPRPSGLQPALPAEEAEHAGENADGTGYRSEWGALIALWFVLVVVMVFLARENLSVPGLYYDEAVFAGMTKDFLTGHTHGQHMPGSEAVQVFGRPFP